MNHAVEMGLGSVIYITKFREDWFRHSNVNVWGFTYRHTHRNVISYSYFHFSNKESRLKR
jgi:hypothetical protein